MLTSKPVLWRRWRYVVSAAAAITIGLVWPAAPAHADLKLCAKRSGPDGPCTCKNIGDGPGQFTVVPSARCRRSDKAGLKKGRAGTGAATVRSAPPQRPPLAVGANDVGAPDGGERSSANHIVTGANPEPTPSRLESVRKRDKLICGVNDGLLGFSHRSGTGEWAGLDVDFCRAVAATVLGDGNKVEFVPLDATARFEALASGKIDLLARNTTWTMSREADLGIEFVGVNYFDGQSFMTSDERGLVSAQQLAGTTICVQDATTTLANMNYYFEAHKLRIEPRTFRSREALIKAYLSGECVAYTSDRSALFADRAGFEDPTKHAVLPEVISKEPLGPAVAAGDRNWFQVVRWVLAGLINAEEVGLDREKASGAGELEGDAKRLVAGAGTSGEKLGLSQDWLRKAIASVGHYGETFENNIGRNGALGMERGINSLWKKGGIVYAPPMW